MIVERDSHALSCQWRRMRRRTIVLGDACPANRPPLRAGRQHGFSLTPLVLPPRDASLGYKNYCIVATIRSQYKGSDPGFR